MKFKNQKNVKVLYIFSHLVQEDLQSLITVCFLLFQLLYCGGSMVELLITSDIAKYCEFKTLSRMLTLIDGKLRKVSVNSS